ncbi:Thyroid receptor-interacting 11, partial [Brachionus plicatilis]
MSWLASGLSKSVTGRITQIGDQLKDILTEGTEEVYDPENELKVVSEKLKENEKKLDLLKMECARWEDETNELNQRCLTYEAQIEQKQTEFRQSIISKENIIADLRNQLSQMETSNHGYQKSAFMEEYEEVMPSSDLNDFIYLDKELKRLKEDNLHLKNENQELLSKIKLKNKQIEETQAKDNDSLFEEKKIEIENLKQEIFGLKKRLEMENDQHQQD